MCGFSGLVTCICMYIYKHITYTYLCKCLSLPFSYHAAYVTITSLDIMECKDGLHNCSQVCIELQGEFSCTCYGGYELLEDGVSCKGT